MGRFTLLVMDSRQNPQSFASAWTSPDKSEFSELQEAPLCHPTLLWVSSKKLSKSVCFVFILFASLATTCFHFMAGKFGFPSRGSGARGLCFSLWKQGWKSGFAHPNQLFGRAKLTALSVPRKCCAILSLQLTGKDLKHTRRLQVIFQYFSKSHIVIFLQWRWQLVLSQLFFQVLHFFKSLMHT